MCRVLAFTVPVLFCFLRRVGGNPTTCGAQVGGILTSDLSENSKDEKLSMQLLQNSIGVDLNDIHVL